MRAAGPPHDARDLPDALEPAQLDALREVPKGAVALAGLAVGLLLVAWLLIYLLVYLPRGMVG